MSEQIKTTIHEMHRIADLIDQMVTARTDRAVPFRWQLARAHALALADELTLIGEDLVPSAPSSEPSAAGR